MLCIGDQYKHYTVSGNVRMEDMGMFKIAGITIRSKKAVSNPENIHGIMTMLTILSTLFYMKMIFLSICNLFNTFGVQGNSHTYQISIQYPILILETFWSGINGHNSSQ